jgi:predicted RNA-binding Zn ribbon-like protein
MSVVATDEAKPAPGALRRVQALINSVDRESGQDQLGELGGATHWLTANGLLAEGATVGDSDLAAVISVREALRALVIHNNGGPLAEAAPAALRAIAVDGSACVSVDDRGVVSVRPAGGALRARLLGLLLIVRDAQLDGTWVHLKACANDGCQWAFYDRSRNHRGTWCDMASCGNKLKNREFRARRKRVR